VKFLFLSVILLLAPLPIHADASKQKLVRMATTTSTDNTGLLKTILPEFEAQTGYEVQVVAVGTGKALKMGRDGDVDVVLVHARTAEEKFVADGYGTSRNDVMYNEFVLIGPDDDPAKIKSAVSASEALKLIRDSGSKFISRGDDSGTHKKEKNLWKISELVPSGKWYMEAGQGMGKIIQISGELDAYTLTDSGTWLVYKEKSPLQLLYKGDKVMHNPYGIIAVNPEQHKDLNHEGATALIDWIISAKAQKLIGDFRFYDRQLFVPNALNAKP
jgi:tungstate transport system substrate-binding protein